MSDPVTRLRALDTCAISDACDQLGIEGCVSTAARPLTGATTIAGRVITIELGPASGVPAPHHLCASATDAADSDSIIVIAHQGRTDSAGWGGNLSRAALQRSAAGTLIDGAARDIDESISIGYPVFATASTPRTARRRTKERSWGQPITFDAITVHTGDYAIADSTGVVFVPAGVIEDVLVAAETIVARETAIADELTAGRPAVQAMGVSYEQMLET